MTESEHQIAFFQWVKVMSGRDPRLATIFSVPNGGYRSKVTGARMRAEGALSGVWDIFVPVPVGQSAGLWIEMKCGKNKLTANQIIFRESVGDGYLWAICYTYDDAIRTVSDYLGIVSGLR